MARPLRIEYEQIAGNEQDSLPTLVNYNRGVGRIAIRPYMVDEGISPYIYFSSFLTLNPPLLIE